MPQEHKVFALVLPPVPSLCGLGEVVEPLVKQGPNNTKAVGSIPREHYSWTASHFRETHLLNRRKVVIPIMPQKVVKINNKINKIEAHCLSSNIRSTLGLVVMICFCF